MKLGELVILWVGGLLSVAVLVTMNVPTSIRDEILRGGPTPMAAVVGYIFERIAILLVIWIICALVWLTIYRRSKQETQSYLRRVKKGESNGTK